MAKFDMAAKRAERLLRKNWTSVVAEAHRLGGLGLPSLKIFVAADFVRLEVYPIAGYGLEVVLSENGDIERIEQIQWQDGHWEANQGGTSRAGCEAVVEILQLAIDDAQARASEMGKASEEMAKIC